MTIIRPCYCKHEYQDKKYGPGNRVHNTATGKNGVWMRCTVCGQAKGK